MSFWGSSDLQSRQRRADWASKASGHALSGTRYAKTKTKHAYHQFVRKFQFRNPPRNSGKIQGLSPQKRLLPAACEYSGSTPRPNHTKLTRRPQARFHRSAGQVRGSYFKISSFLIHSGEPALSFFCARFAKIFACSKFPSWKYACAVTASAFGNCPCL